MGENRKNLQAIYLIKSKYPKFTRNFYNSIAKKQTNKKPNKPSNNLI
jgi:hypothetical protein